MFSVKKNLIAVAFAFSSVFMAFSGEFRDEIFFDFGIGAGGARYGDSSIRDMISEVPGSHQIVLNTNAVFLYPLEKRIFVTGGFDTVFDICWGGGESVFLWDYSFTVGFRFYPNLAGICFDVDYALGRRTDFYDLEIEEDGVVKSVDGSESTRWGNGFIIGFAYDFSYHTDSSAPEISFNWKHMPRGGSSDNYLNLNIRLKI